MENNIILTKEYSNNTQATFYTETDNIQMNIDGTALKHIINRLTELYKNPLEASIRELVSNAVDATVSAKLEDVKPIQLFLDEYNNFLSVEDFGSGMSYDDLLNIYSKYGASTKRDDFSAIGSYGLGAKAPLSYTDSFTLITTKDKETVVAIVSKTDSFPQIQIISKEITENPNGTKVQISLNDNDSKMAYQIFEDYIRFSDMMSVPVVFTHNKGFNKSSIQEIESYKALYPLSTKIKINDDLSLKIFTNESSFERIFPNGNININFVMEGYSYQKYPSNIGVWVQLVPGLLDFNSARDEILENTRYRDFENLIKEQINNIKLLDEREFLNYHSSIYNIVSLSSNSDYEYLENYKDDSVDFSIYNFKENKGIEFPIFSNGQDRRDLGNISLNKIIAFNLAKGFYNRYVVISSDEEVVRKKVKAISREINEYFFLVSDKKALSVLEDQGFEIISKEEVFKTLKESTKSKVKAGEILFKVKKVIFSKGDYKIFDENVQIKEVANKILLIGTDYSPSNSNLNSIINKYNPKQKDDFVIYYATNKNKDLLLKFKNIKKSGLLDKITLVKGNTTYYNKFPDGFTAFLNEHKDFIASESEELLQKITKENYLATVFNYIRNNKPYDAQFDEVFQRLVFNRDKSISYHSTRLNKYTIEKNLSTFKEEFLPALTRLSDFAKCLNILKDYNDSICEEIKKDFDKTLAEADEVIEKYYKKIK